MNISKFFYKHQETFGKLICGLLDWTPFHSQFTHGAFFFFQFETADDAQKVRQALHGCKWPSTNPKILRVEFCTEEEVSVSWVAHCYYISLILILKIVLEAPRRIERLRNNYGCGIWVTVRV